MPNIGSILSGPIGLLVSGVKDLIGQKLSNDHDKQEVAAKLAELEQATNAAVIESGNKFVDDQRDVIVAELQQDDKYTKRARPTLLYSFVVTTTLNYGILPWIARLTGHDFGPIPIPAEILAVWAAPAGLYVWKRSEEKISSSGT